MQRSFLAFTLFLFCFGNGYAQQNIPALRQQLVKAQPDSVKLRLLNELAWEFKGTSPDSGIKYAKQALALAEKTGLQSGIGDSYNYLGIFSRSKGQYHEALAYYRKSIALREKLGDKNGAARSYSNMALVHQRLNHNDTALGYYLKALKLREELGDKAEVGKSYNSLGNFYYDQHSFEKALGYYRRALYISQAANDKLSLGLTYTNIGNVYLEQGLSDSALYFYNLSLQIHRQSGNLAEQAGVYNNIGSLYNSQERYDSALVNFKRALQLYQKTGAKDAILEAQNNIGVLYNDRGDYKEALKWYTQSLALAKEINARQALTDIYGNLSNIYYNLKQYETAFDYRDRHIALKDSLFNENKQRVIAEMQEKYESDKKEQAIAGLQKDEQLRKKQRDMAIVAALLLLVLLVSVLAIYRQKVRSREQLAQKNEELGRQRMGELLKDQELRLVNAVVENQEQERRRIAEDLHDRLGSMLATVKLHFNAVDARLDNMQQYSEDQHKKANRLLDEACQEVRRIAHNMVSGILIKFGLTAALNDLKETIEGSSRLRIQLLSHGMNERLESSLEISLYRVIQELLSNIIKHADAQEVSIQLQQHDGSLNIIVEDDGKGFDTSGARQGMGLRNIASRVEKLDGSFTIDSQPGRGTTAIIDIPIHKTKTEGTAV